MVYRAKRHVQWSVGLVVLMASLIAAPAQTSATVVAWGNNGYGQLDIPSIPTNVIAVSAGANHNLALQADGTVVAWGRNNKGQATVPVGLSNVAAVAASGSHSLALKKDGHVVGWGVNSAGQLNVPATLSNVIAIATRGDHCLAVRLNGSVAGWGAEYSGQAAFLGSLTNAIAVAAGSDHALALRADGTAVAWGTNDVGQMNVPVDLSNVVAIAAGGDHCLALTADGKVVAWGKNDTNQASVPAGLSNVVAIAARSSCSLAVKDDGTIVGWGNCPSNQPALTNVLAASVGDLHAVAVAGGGKPLVIERPLGGTVFSGQTAYLHVLAVAQGPLSYQWQCQGTNVPGATNRVLALSAREPGDFGPYRVVITNLLGSVTTEEVLLTVVEGPPVLRTQIEDQVQYLHGKVLFRTEAFGSAPLRLQWRFNDADIPGANGPSLSLTNLTSGYTGLYSLVASNSFSAVTSAPARLTVVPVATWGKDSEGQAALFPELTNAVAVAAGSEHSVALKADGTVFAWGLNSAGQTDVPEGLSNVVAVAAGNSHCLALKSDGTVTGWGNNAYGQIDVPSDLSNVVAIAARGSHSLALMGNGIVLSWGTLASAPASLSNAVAIAAGGKQDVALRADGTVTNWGVLEDGRLIVPSGLSNVVEIASGGEYSLALRSDGTVIGWGESRLFGGSMAPVPVGLSNVVAIASRSSASLAVQDDGHVVTWGDTAVYGAVPEDLTNVVAASVGDKHCLALMMSDGAPFLTGPLSDRVVPVGGRVYFHASASGILPLSFQWQFNGTNLANATNAVLVLTNVQLAQGGGYSVTVSNPLGSATSRSAHLTMVPAVITAQPQSRVLQPAGSVTFSVTVQSFVPVMYQWRFNGVDLPGGTNAILELGPGAASGRYSVVVSNTYGTVTSAEAVLSRVLVSAWGANSYGQTTVPLGVTNVVALAAGYHSLALRSDRTVVAWGDSPAGQGTVPTALSNVLAIACAGYHSLALKADGTVIGWGYNNNGQTLIPPSLSNVVAIAAGPFLSFALRADGAVVAWGDNDYGQTNIPAGLTNVVAIAGGYDHSLALRADGTIAAWGGDASGETNVPTGLTNVVAIAAGAYFSLALRADRTVVAWGWNAYGQTDVPAGLTNVVAIAAGDYHSLSLRADGTVVAWGSNGYGQTNVPAGLTNVAAIAAGNFHSLALVGDGVPFITSQPADRFVVAAGTVYFQASASGAWPLNYQWQFNGTNLANATNAVLVLTDVQLAQAGDYSVTVSNPLGSATGRSARLSVVPFRITAQPQSATLQPAGSVTFSVAVQSFAPLAYQWRLNGVDLPGATNVMLQLGTNAASGYYSVLVSNTYGTVISAEAVLSMVFVSAWGANDYGQTTVPVNVTNVVAIASGWSHNLALRFDGTVIGWGNNNQGQTTVPTGLSNVLAIACGGSHSLALKADGTVVAWGYNIYGQTNVPAGLTDVVAIAAGYFHSLALRADGTVVVWGDNRGATVPVDLTNVVAIAATSWSSSALRADGSVVDLGGTGLPAGLMNVVAIAGGYRHSLALRADGTVVAWGYDFYGPTNVPTGLTSVVAIAGGSSHNLALRFDGTVIGWGDNYYGETNVPAGLTNVAAIAAGSSHSLALVGSGAPFIASLAADRFALARGTVYFQASASGAGPLHYQWQFNGTDLPGATNALLVLTNVQPTQAGSYSVTVSNALGTATSRNARLSVVAAWITSQPHAQTAALGGSVSFSLAVESLAPITYQWQFNGGALPGATNATLHLDHLTFAAAGGYSVVVSNAYGAVTSADAALSVVVVAAWGSFNQTMVPAGLTNAVAIAGGVGYMLALRPDGTVVASGLPGYYLPTSVPAGLTNVAAIAATRRHSLALRADGTVVAWDNYYGQTVVPAGLTNVVGIADGYEHSLALRANGTVVAWGDNFYGQTTVPAGLTNVVAIACESVRNLALRFDGTVVAWGDNSQTTVPVGLTNVVAIAAGGSHSLALRADGTVVAWGDNVVGQTTVPAGLTNVVAIAAGESHSLALRANGTVVGWGDNYSGETSTPAGLTNVVAIAGGYDHSLALVGNGSPALTVQPYSQSVAGGASVLLHAGAVGKPPMTFQWQLNGTNIAGATNATLQLSHVQLAQAGSYSVVVSNALGNVTSRAAHLYVLVPPSFDPLPGSTTAILGSDVTFTIDATGTPPLLYQWRKNGVNLRGATNSTFTVTNVQVPDGASYSVVVANDVGSITSDPTLLVVEVLSQAPPEDDFANRRVLAGTNGFASGTNVFATREAGEPYHANKFGSNSVWYKWTAPATGIASFRTIGSTFDTLLGIYTGTNVAALNLIAEDEDRGGFLTSQARFNAQQNVEYQIAVDGFAGGQGTFILNWDLEVTADVLPVISTTPKSQTVLQGASAVFTVSASGSGLTYQWSYNFKRINGEVGPLLQLNNVQPGNVGLYSVAITNSSGRGVESLPARLEIGSVATVQSVGKIQDLLFSGGGGVPLAGLYGKSASANAGSGELLVGMGTINSQITHNISPTNSGVPLDAVCSGIGSSSRTLTLLATNSGTMVIDTIGSAIDTLLAVYTFSGLGFSTLICDNNSADGRSLVRFEAAAGTRYYVAADGVNGAQGTIYLNWAMGRAPTVNVVPTNQVVARGSTLTFSITVSNAIPPARCQWMLNLQAIAGATNTTLFLPNVEPANAGVYSVLVRNAIDSVLLQVALVQLQPEFITSTQSRFEHDGDAWSFFGDASWNYQTTGGRYGGYLSALSQRAGGKWNWAAPGKFLGNQLAAYGGSLQFDLRQSGGGNASTNPPRVSLSGNGLTLYFQTGLAAGTNWTSYQVQLKEGGLGWVRSDDTPAFGPDLQRVLANLTGLQISGEFNANSETAGLDAAEFLIPCTDYPPPLSISWQANPLAVILEWPISALCFQLEMADNLRAASWTSNVTVLASIITNGVKRVSVSPGAGGRFFRLRKADSPPSLQQAPALTISYQANPPAAVLQWPVGTVDYQLEKTDNLRAPNWTTNLNLLNSSVSDNVRRVTVNLSNTNQFFRLRQR